MATARATEIVTNARQTLQQDRPAASLDETSIMEAAARAARLATSDSIQRAAGIFEQSSHGANKTAPVMKRKEFFDKLSQNPAHQGKSFHQKGVMWESYMKNAQQERAFITRGDLGVMLRRLI